MPTLSTGSGDNAGEYSVSTGGYSGPIVRASMSSNIGWSLKERAGSTSPGGIGMSFDSGKSWNTYTLSLYDTDDLREAILYILGGVDIAGNGALSRQLPKANPLMPHHFASRITSIVGQGVNVVAEADPLSAEPIFPYYALYQSVPAGGATTGGVYEVRVEFEPRPYDVIPDEEISVKADDTYYNDAGVATLSPWILNSEYQRFTDFEIDPTPTLAYAQIGQMSYYTGSAVVSDTSPHQKTYAGFPFTVLPDGVFRVIWYQVPYALAFEADHPMHAFVGRVNQREFLGRPAGSLLYMGAKFRRYLPPVPEYDSLSTGLTFRNAKVCDVIFTFNYTGRRATDPPNFAAVNRNWIADGWNTQPWRGDGKFYYVGNSNGTDTPSRRVPQFLSAPMQYLFSVKTGYGMST